MFRKWSEISIYHYIKLLFRSMLLILVLVDVLFGHSIGGDYFRMSDDMTAVILMIIWCIYMIEMILRMLPSSVESMGCQKLFRKNAKGLAERPSPRVGNVRDMLVGHRSHGRFAVFCVWAGLNGIIGILYHIHIIDEAVLMIIALVYSVCDMICILFFCPFQTWFMKNRCCVSCYIYNWDYAMMFTPFIFIPHWYTYSLLCMALVVVTQWEIKLRLYPERFDARLNDSLKCRNCTEKLCKHKKQLQTFIVKLEKAAKVEDDEFLNGILGVHNKYDKEEQ